MTEKRFKFIHNDVAVNLKTPIIHDNICMNIGEVLHKLNELSDKCEFLEIENESLEEGATKYAELYHKSLKENEQLKKELKRCKDWINSDKKGKMDYYKELKYFVTHSEATTNQKELQKIIYKMIHDLLDEKMKENMPLSLTCYIPRNCEHRHACHENHQKNTASMARYAILKELKEELPYE